MSDVFEGLYPKVVLSPLALSVVLDAHLRRQKAPAALCTLLGTILDDGSLLVNDAIPNLVISSHEDGMARLLMPHKQHHESFVTARQRVNPRELVLGWGSTDMDMAALHTIAAWARTETRYSKFMPQKRNPTPISLHLSPPTASSDLEVRVEVRGPAPDYPVKLVPVEYSSAQIREFVSPPTASTAAERANEQARGGHGGGFDTPPTDLSVQASQDLSQELLDRIEAVIVIAAEAKAAKNELLARELHRLVAVSLPADTETYNAKEQDEAGLFEWVSAAAKLELELAHKLKALRA